MIARAVGLGDLASDRRQHTYISIASEELILLAIPPGLPGRQNLPTFHKVLIAMQLNGATYKLCARLLLLKSLQPKLLSSPGLSVQGRWCEGRPAVRVRVWASQVSGRLAATVSRQVTACYRHYVS